MPNGGPDNCGECRFNPLSTVRQPDIRLASTVDGRCEIRGLVGIDRPFYTYCANYHTGDRAPRGPVFAAGPEHERLPWHDREPVRVERLEAGGWRLAVRADGRHQVFEDAAAYLAWWCERHPDENAGYPWELHKAMLDPSRRAAGRDDRPRGLLIRLRRRLRR